MDFFGLGARGSLFAHLLFLGQEFFVGFVEFLPEFGFVRARFFGEFHGGDVTREAVGDFGDSGFPFVRNGFFDVIDDEVFHVIPQGFPIFF